jgi:hypothetical protein
MKIGLCALLCILSLSSCEELLFKSNPPNTPEENFEVFWSDFDRYYSQFELKKVNWDSAYAVNRSLINSKTSGQQLFDVISRMLKNLRDGHAGICARQYGCSFFKFTANYPTNRIRSVSGYVFLQRKGANFNYGSIVNYNSIGYVQITSFSGSYEEFEAIDDILSSLRERGATSLILDIRGNGGGSDANSGLIAGRFTTEKLIYSFIRYKSGPGHGEFTGWKTKTVIPGGEVFKGPVVLLTNREVFSSAEDFVLAMQSIPTVTVIGARTGGGSGNPVSRTLPNGWIVHVPRWQQVDLNYEFYEGIGLAPDIAVEITRADSIAGKDTILERAVELLKNK